LSFILLKAGFFRKNPALPAHSTHLFPQAELTGQFGGAGDPFKVTEHPKFIIKVNQAQVKRKPYPKATPNCTVRPLSARYAGRNFSLRLWDQQAHRMGWLFARRSHRPAE
jgi:hypothetical protein